MYLVDKTGNKIPVYPLPYNCNVYEIIKTIGKWLTHHEKYGKRKQWFSEPLFIDTETSHDGEKIAWVHQWAVCWGDLAIIGRTAEQLIHFLMQVNSCAQNLGSNKHVLAYIHNLSYDIEYLRQFFPDHEPDYFAIKPHKILTARYERLEIRCSYLLTQKPLAKWGEDSAKKYTKLKGAYDYDIIRTPNTPLTDDEWSYQLNDVFTMRDAWWHDRDIDGYDVTNIPLTSTGFVRADCRKASKSDYYWKKKLDEMQPDIEVYNALEEVFSGGYTHGNRFYKNQTVYGKIGHRDFCSSYPARQCVNGFPMGKFVPSSVELNEISHLKKSMCFLLYVELKNPRLKDRHITAPFLSYSKCISCSGKLDSSLDNGRVLRITGAIRTWLTEYDYIIMSMQYTQDEIKIIKAYEAPKSKLPKWLRDKVMEYFTAKNTKKYTDPSNYLRAKMLLNGIFGMTAEKSVRDTIKYINGEWKITVLDADERNTELIKHNKKDSTFGLFCWGCWATSIAKFELFNCLIYGCGYDNYLYCDTDSLFYVMTDDTEKRFAEYNNIWCSRAIECGAYVDYEGKKSVLGEFTPEEDMPLTAFRFLHAKCYAVIAPNKKTGKDELKVTIAGVTKYWRSNDKKTAADELKTIGNLAPGFKFIECGGTRIVYNNDEPHIITIKGCDIVVGASAVILPTEYQIKDRDETDIDDLAIIDTLSNFYLDTEDNFIDIK